MGVPTVENLMPDEFDMLQYVVSMSEAKTVCQKMRDLGWVWVPFGQYRAAREGPGWVCTTGDELFTVRPWKKSSGAFVWRTIGLNDESGEPIEFGSPVACVVAQVLRLGDTT